MTKTLLILFGLVVMPAMADVCTDAPNVAEVYPRADALPENLLRLYVYFDQPMDRKNALAAIRLLDESDALVEGAFLTNKVDLWSPDSRRLTVLFDPGRVKTGLRAHHTMGRALQSGSRYTLVIESSLMSTAGCSLAAEHRKPFRVTEANYDAPDPERWRVRAPQAHSTDWVSVLLNGPHDHVSLAYRVRVVDANGAIVPGRIDLGAADAEWRFQPAEPWKEGTYRITVDPTLEDVAGNRLTGSFERPLSDGNASTVSIKFKTVNKDIPS
ncbi:MAG: hypothetical protein ACR2P1_29615 [Pseudomonadales bacterium]